MKIYQSGGGWLDYANEHGLPVELPDVPDEVADDDATVIDAEWIDYDALTDAE